MKRRKNKSRKMEKLEKQERSAQGVIVTVYEESSKLGSRPCPQKIRRTTNAKPTTRSCGYDRRAELLAYAHQLRNVNDQHIQRDHSSPTDTYQPQPKIRRRLLGRLKVFRFSFGTLFKGEKKAWKYQNIETSTGGESAYRSHPSHCRGRNRWNVISKRLRRLLKRFSCGCKCSKGVDHNDEHCHDLHRAQSSH